MRLCRCVVPVRGWPTMTIGRAISIVEDLGVLPHQVLDEEPVPHVTDHLRVGAHAARSPRARRCSSSVVSTTPSGSRNASSPKSSRPVSARAASSTASGANDRSAGERLDRVASSRRCAAGTSGRRDRRCGPPAVARSWRERRRRRAPASTGGSRAVTVRRDRRDGEGARGSRVTAAPASRAQRDRHAPRRSR